MATEHSDPPPVEATQATVVIVGGHEGGGTVPLEPLAEHGPLLRAPSAAQLEETVQLALDGTDQPVCVVPMTLGRDPELVADTARVLTWLTGSGAGGSPAAGRVVLAEPFGNITLLTGWLRVAVSRAAGSGGAKDTAVLLTANPHNRFDDAELFRVAHLVRVQEDVPWVEVAFHGGDPDFAAGVERCGILGARQIAVIPAGFGPALDTPLDVPLPDVIDGGPLLTPAAISGMLATRVAAALLKLSRGDDGINAGLDADHEHGHGGLPWQEQWPEGSEAE